MEPCANCRRLFKLEELDAKPHNFTFREMSATFGQIHALQHAADRGFDFTRLECADCYGPGYVSLISS